MAATLELRSNPRHGYGMKLALIVSGIVLVSLFFGLLLAGVIFRGEITPLSMTAFGAPVIGIVNLASGAWLLTVPQDVRLDEDRIESRRPPFHRSVPWDAVRRVEIVGLDDESSRNYGVSFVSSVGEVTAGVEFRRSDLRELSTRARALAARRGIRVVEAASVTDLTEQLET